MTAQKGGDVGNFTSLLLFENSRKFNSPPSNYLKLITVRQFNIKFNMAIAPSVKKTSTFALTLIKNFT
jgi:hypothetical protein